MSKHSPKVVQKKTFGGQFKVCPLPSLEHWQYWGEQQAPTVPPSSAPSHNLLQSNSDPDVVVVIRSVVVDVEAVEVEVVSSRQQS